MQQVAAEMNLSETAFLYSDQKIYHLRWFTPVTEVHLCGHATLASAHVLWEEKHVDRGTPIEFETQSGRLRAVQKEDWIEIDLPADAGSPVAAPGDLLRALGVEAVYAEKTRFDYLIEVETETVLREMKPDFTLLASVPTRGVIVTCKSTTPGYDFISRFFAPRHGIPEDPVTGSAHCALGPFWAERMGKNQLTAYQASPRGGVMVVVPMGDRVFLRGEAITVFKGTLL